MAFNGLESSGSSDTESEEPQPLNISASWLSSSLAPTYIPKWKLSVNMVLSLLICALLIVEVISYAENQNGTMRSTLQSYFHHFLPDQQEHGTAVLGDLQATIEFLKHTVTQYYRLPELLPGVYSYCSAEGCDASQPIPPHIKVWYIEDATQSTLMTMSCNLNEAHPAGPFDACDAHRNTQCPCIPNLTTKAVRFEVDLDVVTTPPCFRWITSETLFKCSEWNIRQLYDLGHQTGLKTVTLVWGHQDCPSQASGNALIKIPVFWLGCTFLVIRLILAATDLVLRLPCSIWTPFRTLRQLVPTKGLLDENSGTAEEASQFWFIWAVAADGFTILCTIVVLRTLLVGGYTNYRWFSLGIACMMQFVLICAYLKHDPRLYLLFHTLRNSLPVLGVFLLSSLPMFISFALFGTLVLGKQNGLFATMSNSMMTLFALLNGDSVAVVLASADNGSTMGMAIISQLYIVLYILLGVFVVGNIARVIVVEAYNHIMENLPTQTRLIQQRIYPEEHHHALNRWASVVIPRKAYSGQLDWVARLHLSIALSICILITTQVTFQASTLDDNLRETEKMLKQAFLGTKQLDALNSYRAHLYATDEVVEHVHGIVQAYYSLETNSPDFFSTHRSNGHGLAPTLTLQYCADDVAIRPKAGSQHSEKLSCPLTHTHPLGPFGPKGPRSPCQHVPHIERRVQDMQVSMNFRTAAQLGSQSCRDWHVTLSYDFSSRTGVVSVLIELHPSPCSTQVTPLSASPSAWMRLIVLSLTVLHLTLGTVVRYRLVLGDTWRRIQLLAMLSNLLWVAEDAAFMVVFSQPSRTAMDFHVILHGLICCLNWLVISGYLELRPAFRHLGSSLRTALPLASSFIIGALPVFLGYCALGTVFFGYFSNRFGSLRLTASTLFAALNGDSVLDFFLELRDPNSAFVSFASSLYLYTFIPLMLYGPVNIFLVITEEAYRQVAQEHGHLAVGKRDAS